MGILDVFLNSLNEVVEIFVPDGHVRTPREQIQVCFQCAVCVGERRGYGEWEGKEELLRDLCQKLG